MGEPKIAGDCAPRKTQMKIVSPFCRQARRAILVPALQALAGQISLKSLASAGRRKMVLGRPAPGLQAPAG
jgi:hypothetical protein